MTVRKKSGSMLGSAVSLPYQFLSGLVIGVVAPVAAVAAMAALIRLVTGKVPFLSHTWPEEGDDRHLSIKLMTPEEARAVFEREQTRIKGDLNRMSTEIQSLAQQAQAKARASMPNKE